MNEVPLNTDEGDFLVFKAGGDTLTLPAKDIAEILRPRAITRVPHSPASLLGVANLRGTVMPIVSVARLLSRDSDELSSSSRIVVFGNDVPVGLLVDEVSTLTKATSERRIDVSALLARDFGALMRRNSFKREERIAMVDARSNAAVSTQLILIGFDIAGQDYAFALDKVMEVMALPAEFTELPGTDSAMIGVTSLRGKLLPLASLRVLLGLSTQGFDPTKARVVVTRIGSALVGLVTDGMKAILRVSADAVDPVPLLLTRGQAETQIEAICRLEGGRQLIAILSPSRLFDQDTAARIMAADHDAAEMPGTLKSEKTEQFVVFQLGDASYGLPIDAVDEVVRCPDDLTRVPRAPEFVLGVMNLRGKIVPVIDQRQRFGVGAPSDARARRIVVVTVDARQAGFVADTVSEVISIAQDELTEAPDGVEDGNRTFDRIASLSDGRTILLIDPHVLLGRAERDILAAIAESASAP